MTYTIDDILKAECTLDPLKCIHRQSLEVTFDQHIKDAYCANCGQWQKNYENTSRKINQKLPEIIEFVKSAYATTVVPCECSYLYAVFPSIDDVDPIALKCRLKKAGFIIEQTSDISPFGWNVVHFTDI